MQTRIPYLDHCPECTLPVPCRPLSTLTVGDAVTAQYRCRRCLHSWRTGWQREPEES